MDIMATEEKVPYEKTHVLTMLEQKSGCSTTDESGINPKICPLYSCLNVAEFSGNISLAPLNISSAANTTSTPSNNSLSSFGESQQAERELPFWMIFDAEDLHNYYLNIKIPDIYKSITKSICQAGATSVDLSKLSKYFYEFGIHMSRLDDENVIGSMLLDTARQRLSGLFDSCNFTDMDDRKEHNFENCEKLLFQTGCENFSNVRTTGTPLLFFIYLTLFCKYFSTTCGSQKTLATTNRRDSSGNGP